MVRDRARGPAAQDRRGHHGWQLRRSTSTSVSASRSPSSL